MLSGSSLCCYTTCKYSENGVPVYKLSILRDFGHQIQGEGPWQGADLLAWIPDAMLSPHPPRLNACPQLSRLRFDLVCKQQDILALDVTEERQMPSLQHAGISREHGQAGRAKFHYLRSIGGRRSIPETLMLWQRRFDDLACLTFTLT